MTINFSTPFFLVYSPTSLCEFLLSSPNSFIVPKTAIFLPLNCFKTFNAEKIGTQVTTKNDVRVTKVGSILRKCRLDELPQLLNIISGDMSFVGTRPEVPKYVDRYTEEMLATLLLPAGITSEASIEYKDEDRVLSEAQNVDDTYVCKILPGKMKYNLEAIKRFSFFREIKTMFRTVVAVVKN